MTSTPTLDPQALLAHYQNVRGLTELLIKPLSAEDMLVQAIPHASPTKWHLAHTTWFFETFLLAMSDDYSPFDPLFGYLFNSYYNAIGDRIARNQRSILSRPSAEQVQSYRRNIDQRMHRLLNGLLDPERASRTLLGLHHEQQHQELILTDIKIALGSNPLRPAYLQPSSRLPPVSSSLRWVDFPEGLYLIGHSGQDFAFDNESPRHQVFLRPFQLASRLTTCGEFLAFMQDGGYERPELWLSDGWDTCRAQGWKAPLYWEKQKSTWYCYTLTGLRPLEQDEPICHVSYYEADAFARWSQARLPTEAEWEVAAATLPLTGSFLEAHHWHPCTQESDQPLSGMFGEVWQWTASPYLGYPGYRVHPGALGEYNGKFMCNQFVLRGGSCLTPRSHFRISYRNFFPPDARWQFTGLRLARDK